MTDNAETAPNGPLHLAAYVGTIVDGWLIMIVMKNGLPVGMLRRG